MVVQQRSAAFNGDEVRFVGVDHIDQFIIFRTVQDISRLDIQVGHTIQHHAGHAFTDCINRIALFLDDFDE